MDDIGFFERCFSRLDLALTLANHEMAWMTWVFLRDVSQGLT